MQHKVEKLSAEEDIFAAAFRATQHTHSAFPLRELRPHIERRKPPMAA